MLQPARTKFRKQHKGRIHGAAKTGTALNFGASSPIDIQIDGGTSDQAMELAREIRNRAANVKGTADVRIAQRLDAPNLQINVDRQKAASVGLTARDVMMQVVAAMNSSVSINRNFWIDTKNGNQYFVAVQYPEDPNLKLEDVLNIYATGTNQPHGVKLGQLVAFAKAPKSKARILADSRIRSKPGQRVQSRTPTCYSSFAKRSRRSSSHRWCSAVPHCPTKTL